MQEAPSAVAAVREVIKGQQRQLQDWYGAELRRLKKHKDLELDRLRQALGVLDTGGEKASSPSTRKPPSRHRRRRRGRASATPIAIRERRDAILRFLIERDEPLPRSTICTTLDLSSSVVRTALTLLTEEGKVVRVGTGAGTRYQAAKGVAESIAASHLGGTPQGRIVAVLQERTYASISELAQATGLSRVEARATCDTLEREGEVYAAEREGRSVYTHAGVPAEA